MTDTVEGVGSLRTPTGCQSTSSISENFNYYGDIDIEDSQQGYFEEKVQPINGYSSDPY